MKKLLTIGTALALLAGSIGAALAQGRDDRDHHDARPGPAMHGPRNGGAFDARSGHGDARSCRRAVHHDWHKGGRIERADWGRGQMIDYRQHHLKRPPRGYEWRQVDNNYVLAAAATGLIASIILANH